MDQLDRTSISRYGYPIFIERGTGMDKILAPADKVLSEIGRVILLRPWLSVLLLLLTVGFTAMAEKAVQNVASKHLVIHLTPLAAAGATDDSPWMSTNLIDQAISSRPSEVVTPPIEESAPDAVISDSKPTIAAATPHLITGQIHRSLFQDAQKLGLPARLANQLAAVSTTIPSHLRVGDKFSVLYDDSAQTKTKSIKGKGRHKQTQIIKTQGNILAVQFTHEGKTLPLIHFIDPKGRGDYYTPNGQSLHEGISRQPIAGARISSGFSYSRFDPYLHFVRPHLGVDYAAPVGTAIHAAGNGVIVGMGYRGGYGNAVVIRHDDKYSTLYGHLSHFASNVHFGQTVQQGQVIGYVGQSGFATGPHLHFEIRANDVPYNPLTVALPGASIPSAYRGRFMAQAKVLMGELRGGAQVHLAQKKGAARQG